MLSEMKDYYYRQFRVKARNVYRYLSGLQKDYNRRTRVPCRGFEYMRLYAPGARPEYCGNPFCPTCWHRKQEHLLNFILEADSNLFFIRFTDEVHWRDVLNRRYLDKIKSRKYRLIAQCISFDKLIGVDDELGYRIAGIYGASKQIHDEDTPGVSYVHETPNDPSSEVIGAIEKFEYDGSDKERVVYDWLSLMKHPYKFRKFEGFDDYIHRFETFRIERSWAKRGITRRGG